MNSQIKLAIVSALGAFALLIASAGTASAQRVGGGVIQLPKVTSVSLGSPLGSGGSNNSCPQNVMVPAVITVNGKCTVKYAWIESDVPGAPTYSTLSFTEAGSKTLYIQISATQTHPTRQGQLTFKVIEPNAITSAPYNYNISCSTGISVNPGNIGIKP